MEREKRDDLFPVFDFIGAAAGHDDFPQWTVGELLQYVRHQFFCPRNRGSSFVLYLKCKEKKKIRFRGVPAYVYLVGFMGIGMVTSRSWCTLAIGATAMTGLSVIGQMISSAVVDHHGWFGIEKQKFNWKELPAYLLVLAGVWLVTTG